MPHAPKPIKIKATFKRAGGQETGSAMALQGQHGKGQEKWGRVSVGEGAGRPSGSGDGGRAASWPQLPAVSLGPTLFPSGGRVVALWGPSRPESAGRAALTAHAGRSS